MYKTGRHIGSEWQEDLFQKTVEEYQKGKIKKRQA